MITEQEKREVNQFVSAAVENLEKEIKISAYDSIKNSVWQQVENKLDNYNNKKFKGVVYAKRKKKRY
jgi:hypothetical protein